MARGWILGVAALTLGCSFSKDGTGELPIDIDGSVAEDSTAPDTHDAEPPDVEPLDSMAPDTNVSEDSALDADAPPPDTAEVEADAPLPTGSISIKATVLGGSTINLTTEGKLGWAHWGHSDATSFNRRAGAALIERGGIFPAGAVAQRLATYPLRFSWTDGEPLAVANESPTGLYVNGVGQGFTFPVAASTTDRKLRIYLVRHADGLLTASLSDKSAPDASAVIPPAGVAPGAFAAVLYTVDFRAATSDAKLTITIFRTPPAAGDSLSLLAASLE